MAQVSAEDLYRFTQTYPEFVPGPAIRLSTLGEAATQFGFDAENFWLFQTPEGNLDFGDPAPEEGTRLLSLSEMFARAVENETTEDPCIVLYIPSDGILYFGITEAAPVEAMLLGMMSSFHTSLHTGYLN